MKILVAAVLTLSVLSLFAQKPITGAFGYQLGEILDRQQIISQNVSVAVVKPKKKFRNFTAYLVAVIPSTGQISGIVASSFLPSSDYISELNLCKNLLETKYGKFQPQHNGYILRNHGRSIRISVHKNQNGPIISILYSDEALNAKFEREIKHKQSSIDGAFGFRFGDHLDRSAIISEVSENWYQVKPPKISSLFYQYGIEVTPQSKRIFAIFGIRAISNTKEMKAVADTLEIEYGDPTTVDQTKGNEHYIWKKSDIVAHLQIVNGKLWFSVTNTKLADQAKSERKKIEVEKSDLSAI